MQDMRIGLVQTVDGLIRPDEVGIALMHEHLHVLGGSLTQVHGYKSDDAPTGFDHVTAAECRWNPGASEVNYRFDDREAIMSDLVDAVSVGVRTIVDVTPIELGRSPKMLQRYSKDTGLNVVMGTGYYLEATHRQVLMRGREEDQTFDTILNETSEGVGGVFPGIIGEIGTSDPPTSSELAVMRGAARAALATGLSLSVHLHPWGLNGHVVADVVEEIGLPPDRLILGHMNTAALAPSHLVELLKRRVVLGFDLFGFDHSLLGLGRYPPNDDLVAGVVADLIERDFVGQITLSQDVGVRTRLRRYGGWGYAHLIRHVVPLLREKGVAPADIEQMLVANTKRLLTVQV